MDLDFLQSSLDFLQLGLGFPSARFGIPSARLGIRSRRAGRTDPGAAFGPGGSEATASGTASGPKGSSSLGVAKWQMASRPAQPFEKVRFAEGKGQVTLAVPSRNG